MNLLNQSDASLARLAPVLDEAINDLGEKDRRAILLRFYERLDLRSVGQSLGISEDAAQKRVSRALEQLRVMLTSRGAAFSGAALGTALAGEALSAAPAGLAASVSVAALKAGLGAGGVPFGVFKAVGLTKLKASALGALAVVAVATPIILQQQAQTRLRAQNEALRRQLVQSASLAEENKRLSNLVVQASGRPGLEADQLRELLRLRGEVTRLHQENKEIEALRLENRQLHLTQASVPSAGGDSNTMAVPAPARLYTRVLKVDVSTVLARLNDSAAGGDANPTQDQWHQAALRRFLNGLGVEIEPPGTVFMDDTNGTVVVRSSLQNLDKIEQAFSVLDLGAK